ncbi:uncharacterized protein E0L32_011573 [Thyridium curvatum]|uniref:Ribosomal protein L19 n=1 Tax=Thyridium curvatum TaxID=1093900 RepID=A0A507B5Y4_9PEZI|nr:uncharacterized protein E0L32_011573 [Thyridium curvatum]TPX18535.1 hypothetical protein E0L32_011573 [Thyridium curvatum]
MNAAPIRRQPLGCLKTVLRQTRQQRQFLRSYASAAETPSTTKSSALLPSHTFHSIPSKKNTAGIRTAFAVYSAPSSSSPPPSHPTSLPTSLSQEKPAAVAAAATAAAPTPRSTPLEALHALQIARMDPTGARQKLFSRTNPHGARVGDVLMVTTRRGAEPFSGVCLSIRRRGIDTAVLLRGQLTRVGVEMWFKVFSRNVAGVEIIHRRAKRARRARLTYMRQPKHDMGSVDNLVQAWRRSRQVLRTRGGGGGAAKGAAGAKGKDGKAK